MLSNTFRIDPCMFYLWRCTTPTPWFLIDLDKCDGPNLTDGNSRAVAHNSAGSSVSGVQTAVVQSFQMALSCYLGRLSGIEAIISKFNRITWGHFHRHRPPGG